MITIVDYGAGNLASIQNILKKTGASCVITSDEQVLRQATRIILPGVGAFDSCAGQLRASGLIPVLEEKVLGEKVPVLGICVGMQLLFSGSEEGRLPGLDWIPGSVVKFDTSKMEQGMKIPHMGWTDVVSPNGDCDLLQNMHDAPRFYFVHSYHVRVDDSAHTLMTARYGYDFPAAVRKDNITGVQFHPEKSHRFGMQLFKNFVESQS